MINTRNQMVILRVEQAEARRTAGRCHRMYTAGLVSAAIARTRVWPWPARYATTAGITIGIFLLRLAAEPILPEGLPYLVYFLAVLLAAALFDHGCGLFATAICAALVVALYFPPLGSLGVEEQRHLLSLAIFAAIAVLMSLTIEALHRALADAQSANEALRSARDRIARTERSRMLLLREFRHRTRNDLGSLVGLLLLRARTAPSEAAREGLREAAEHAMALARVHTHLAASDNLDGSDDGNQPDTPQVNTRAYILGLCTDLAKARMDEGLRPVVLTADAEAHLLDAERAVQLGLVLNEAVTNALKYAFPENRAGTVRVWFAREGEEFLLSVADDGVGLPPDGEIGGASDGTRRHGSGLGTRLLRALAAQLRGSFARRLGDSGAGTVSELRFPVAAQRVARSTGA
jgi:two-component sensor histidine kinase